MAIEIVFFVAVVVLFAAIVIGYVFYARRPRSNIAITNEATEELYKDPQAYAKDEERFRQKAR